MNEINPYISNEKYNVYHFKDRKEWLKYRIRGIGASESSSILGMNSWKTSLELYNEKVNVSKEWNETMTDAQEYGTLAEDPLRRLYELSNKHHTIYYQDKTIFQSKEKEFMLYSPDGIIFDTNTNEWGIYEGKTARILSAITKESWKGAIPNNYFIQLLHGLFVTGFSFAVLNVELRFDYKEETFYERRAYTVRRETHEEDIKYLIDNIEPFWNNHVLKKVPPPVYINI
jgi:putative phage-type endonuclease